MDFKIYNTKSRKKEEFVSLRNGKVGIYVCGPTVNDVPHLGHARQKIIFDVLRKYLESIGYDVTFVSNITDVDDKIIRKANERGISINELTRANLKSHQEDYEKIGVRSPDIQPKATEYIGEMIDLIKILENRGYAYVIPGDGVYYDISKFARYGQFSGQKIENLRAGVRIDIKDKKRNSEDFVLWKFSKLGDPEWCSPWGKGRPGWHIECSAMSYSILGLPIDIHGGGRDLIFPHHEDEIAQSEGAYDKRLANYWMHNGMVNMDSVKMSKSLGNFKTIRDLLDEYSGSVLRYFMLSGHYRKPIDFSRKALDSCGIAHKRLLNLVERLDNDGVLNSRYLEMYHEAMSDDLNVPVALSVIWKLLRDPVADGKYQTVKQIDSVLGLGLFNERRKNIVPNNIQRLLDERELARKKKDWSLADQKRDEIANLKWKIEDTSCGPRVIKIK